MSQARIAGALCISEPTLRAHYREELDEGKGRWEADFEETLGQCALDRNAQNNVLRIFVAKTRFGYRELTPKDPNERGVEDMTNEELAAIVGARARDERERSSLRDPAPKKNRVVAA